MSNKLSPQTLAKRIVEQHSILEEVPIYKFDEKQKIFTDKVDRVQFNAHIPETLLGINLAGFGKDEDAAKSDLSKRLADVLNSDDIDLADDWAERHLDKN